MCEEDLSRPLAACVALRPDIIRYASDENDNDADDGFVSKYDDNAHPHRTTDADDQPFQR